MQEDNSHQTLKTLIEEFQNRISIFDPGIWRIEDFFPIPGKIMVAVGMRRTGKTHFLMQIIKYLLEKKIDIHQILYINFEDDRLYPLSQEKLRQLLDVFIRYIQRITKKNVIFFWMKFKMQKIGQ